MLKLIVLAFFALTAIWEVSARSETCTLKAENAQCVLNSECCSQCCAEGRCSLNAGCFIACDPSILATAEGPDLCRLTKSVAELMDLIKATVNRDLSKGIPVLASVVKLTNLFFVNPLSGIANINDIMKDMQIVRGLLEDTNADTQQILRGFGDIADILTRLLTAITSYPQG